MSRSDAPPATRVFPGSPTPTDIESSLVRPRTGHDGRPWVNVCMVSSLDGAISVGGRSGDLGNANDTAVLHGIRRLADATIVGAGTIRAEGYGRPERPDQRICVVTASGDVDLSGPVFESGAGILVTTDDMDRDDLDGIDVVRAGTGHVDLAAALHELTNRWPSIHHVQAEGGSRLNGSLLDADLVDELDLTLSPMLVGGDAARILTSGHEAVRHMRLEQLVVDEGGFTFGRWVRDR